MEIKKVLQDKDNALFKRKEVTLVVEANSNPSYDETRTALAKKFSKPEEVIVISGIKGEFGTTTFKVSASIYNSEADKKAGEPKPKKKKEKAA